METNHKNKINKIIKEVEAILSKNGIALACYNPFQRADLVQSFLLGQNYASGEFKKLLRETFPIQNEH